MRFTGGRLALALVASAAIAAGTAVGVSLTTGAKGHGFRAPHFIARAEAFETLLGKQKSSGEPSSLDGPAQEDFDNRAFPNTTIGLAQQAAAASAAQAVDENAPGQQTNWAELGPSGVFASGLVASESTAGTAGVYFSGRATAIAISPTCNAQNECHVFVGTAGGGVWETQNGLDPTPQWVPSNKGIPSNAIGSLIYDPTDPSGMTLYAGTGEPNGSGDSEAGVGLFKSTDGGASWKLVPGSTASTAPCASGGGTCPVATGRSIGAIAVDPANPNHILIGTDVARHGSSSSNGGRFTPPGSAKVGLYESTDGGATFTLAFSQPSDVVVPGTSTGTDFFRGGVSHLELYPAAGETQVYASLFDYGIFRRSQTLDGDAAFHQIFGSEGGGSAGLSSIFRTEFSLAPNGGNLRIYTGDGGVPGGLAAQFYRVDNANVPASALFSGGANVGWTKLSNSAKGTPGFSSFNYCTGQCTYDMPVYSPPGAPNVVYIGGAMQYSEIFTANRPSNGRAVQRSEDAGVHFTDMTIDTQSNLSIHPDQHAIASAPSNPNIVFIANDGGIFRLNGSFTDASGQCAGRGLSGADLTDCQMWLSKIPTSISSLNQGLGTLQYQSVSVNPQDPLNDLLGGTQDNGTHAIDGNGNAFVSVFGDGGQSGTNPFHANIRFHNFFLASPDVNFHGTAPTGWDSISDPLFGVEPQSFYIPMIFDPTVDGTMFAGLNFVWRTTDNGGNQAALDAHCNELTGDFTITCGDWVRIGQGSSPLDTTKALGNGSFWGNKGGGGFVVATARAPSDNGTLWVGTRRGRLFVSTNANAAPASVVFNRIDTNSTPFRFVSGIAIDPSDPNTAYVSFSGYNAYDSVSGHVFKVHYNGGSSATWTNISYNLGDEPVTGVALDSHTGDLFVSSDFGVDVLKSGTTTWGPAAGGLPPVATYGLTIDSNARVLYAATHGRGVWKLDLG